MIGAIGPGHGALVSNSSYERILRPRAMTFGEAVEAIEALEGIEVEVVVLGAGEGAASVAVLAGVLTRMRPTVDVPPELADAVEAVVVQVGPKPTNHVSLWPDRFVQAETIDSPDGIEIRTRDGVVRIQPRSRPWID